MECSFCGGPVTWQGPISALTHTLCENCGETDCQIIEINEEEGEL